MYHIIYLTTNTIDNKIYVGKRSTFNLNDGYLGSGEHLKKAIKKYGRDKFTRKILYYCLDEKQAFETESIIVDEWFVKRNDTYNMKCGGLGGMKGYKHTVENLEIIKQKGRNPSLETRMKLSKARISHLGDRYHNNKRKFNKKSYICISPTGITYTTKFLSKFCNNQSLNSGIIYNRVDKGLIVANYKWLDTNSINCIGWTIQKIVE